MARVSRPREVLALAALLGGATACLAAGVAFPMSAQAPVRLDLALMPVTLGMAALTLIAGARLPRWALLAQVALAAVLNSVLVGAAHTTGGAVGDAFAYVWLTVYTALTGVLNRGGLQEAAERVAERRRRRTEALAVAALDLDGFKEVNDQCGHAAGDRLLVEASAAWRGALRRDDVLARTGGDEFVLLLPNTSQDEAMTILERVRDTYPVSWSAGVTDWRDGDTLESCLERADDRLYAAKGAR